VGLTGNQRFEDVDVALADHVVPARLLQVQLNAPVPVGERHPYRAALGVPARQHDCVPMPHRHEGHTYAEIGYAEHRLTVWGWAGS
jgi:hypothetical protein